MAETVYVELPMYDEDRYMYSIVLEGRSYILTFYWNQKASQWMMDIRLEDRTPILLGQGLVAQYPMFVDYNLEELGMTGYFMMLPVNLAIADSAGVERSIVPGFFKLYYVYITGD